MINPPMLLSVRTRTQTVLTETAFLNAAHYPQIPKFKGNFCQILKFKDSPFCNGLGVLQENEKKLTLTSEKERFQG